MKLESKFARLWRRVALGLGLVVAVVLLGLLVKELASPGDVKKKRAVQEISLLKPPPPPPPPKDPPPPPKVNVPEKMDVPKTDQVPDKPTDAPPPGPDLTPTGPPGS